MTKFEREGGDRLKGLNLLVIHSKRLIYDFHGFLFQAVLDDFVFKSLLYSIFIKVFTNCILLCLVTRIIRVIAQPRGNMLLIGIGGSGRQSLSRLSAYIIGFKVFQIEVTKHYRKNEFREGMY